MNKCVFIGRIVRDIELKSTNSGTLVLNNCIAVRRPYSKNKETDFIDFTAWRNAADIISRYFRKGSTICLCGSLVTELKENQGNKQKFYHINVDEVYFTGEKNSDINVPPPNYDNSMKNNDFEEIGDSDNDLPF